MTGAKLSKQNASFAKMRTRNLETIHTDDRTGRPLDLTQHVRNCSFTFIIGSGPDFEVIAPD